MKSEDVSNILAKRVGKLKEYGKLIEFFASEERLSMTGYLVLILAGRAFGPYSSATPRNLFRLVHLF